MIAERDDLALRIHARLEVVEAARAIDTVLHVLPAVPHQLHGLADLLRDGGGFDHEVVAEPAAEAAADAGDVQGDVLFRNPERLGDGGAAAPGICVGDQISTLPSLKCAVVFIGSSVAWWMNG